MDQANAVSTSIDQAASEVVRRVTSDPPAQKPAPATDTVDTAALRKAFTRKYRHTAAIHSKSRPSTLGHDANETPSFLGFRNLGLIVLIAGNLRLLLENIQKYGVLICIRCHDFRAQDLKVGLVLYTLVPCCLLVAYLIELFAVYEARTQRMRASNARERSKDETDGHVVAAEQNRDGNTRERKRKVGSTSPTRDEQDRFKTTWYIIAALHTFNISFALSVTSFVIYYYVNHPLIGTVVEMHAIIVWLKTASYALTNRDLRHSYLHPRTGELEAIPELYRSCPYPENITFGNLGYFWWAPTLIYQPVYPRTDKIRWIFVLKRVGEIVGLCVLMWVLSAQYAAPTLQNSLKALRQWDLAAMVERTLKLSTISLIVWLAGFFALFQSFLNALAEVTRFADRSFYDDCQYYPGMLLRTTMLILATGWNSDSLGTYWRTWNKPVSNYFRRHVFSPLMGRGYSYSTSAIVVFTISAILHELAVGIPTHNIIGKNNQLRPDYFALCHFFDLFFTADPSVCQALRSLA